jgi:hypothetical protein
MAEAEYRITQVNETTMLDAARNPKPGYRVFFAWGSGRSSSVDILKSQVDGLAPEAIAEVKETIIQAEIARMDALW